MMLSERHYMMLSERHYSNVLSLISLSYKSTQEIRFNEINLTTYNFWRELYERVVDESRYRIKNALKKDKFRIIIKTIYIIQKYVNLICLYYSAGKRGQVILGEGKGETGGRAPRGREVTPQRRTETKHGEISTGSWLITSERRNGQCQRSY